MNFAVNLLSFFDYFFHCFCTSPLIASIMSLFLIIFAFFFIFKLFSLFVR